jgi:hypothetical protein
MPLSLPRKVEANDIYTKNIQDLRLALSIYATAKARHRPY